MMQVLNDMDWKYKNHNCALMRLKGDAFKTFSYII